MQRLEQLRQIFGKGLKIGVQQRDTARSGVAKPGIQTRRLTAIDLEMEDPDPVVGDGEIVHLVAGTIRRTVIDEHQLPVDTRAVEGGANPIHQEIETADLVVDGHHHRELAFLGIAHDRRLPDWTALGNSSLES